MFLQQIVLVGYNMLFKLILLFKHLWWRDKIAIILNTSYKLNSLPNLVITLLRTCHAKREKMNLMKTLYGKIQFSIQTEWLLIFYEWKWLALPNYLYLTFVFRFPSLTRPHWRTRWRHSYTTNCFRWCRSSQTSKQDPTETPFKCRFRLVID